MENRERPIISPTKQRNRLIIFVVTGIALIGVAIIATVLTMQKDEDTTPAKQEQPKVSQLFYDSLANASQQERLRVAMLRKTYASQEDMKNNSNPGIENSTVSEIDVKKGKYRNIFANRQLGDDFYTLGRCLDGANYIDARSSGEKPTSLEAANSDIAANKITVAPEARFVTCKRVGLYPEGVLIDLAPVRLTDGVMPVTLNPNQAKVWKEKLQKADLFTFKDEGRQTYNGQQVRKISFTPKSGMSTVNKVLYDAFYEAAEIEKIKAQNNPDAQYEYSFISINPANTGGVKGFYLIDEATKLPVYSELTGVNQDKAAGQPDDTARLNIGLTKQTYAYPSELTLNEASPLELIK